MLFLLLAVLSARLSLKPSSPLPILLPFDGFSPALFSLSFIEDRAAAVLLAKPAAGAPGFIAPLPVRLCTDGKLVTLALGSVLRSSESDGATAGMEECLRRSRAALARLIFGLTLVVVGAPAAGDDSLKSKMAMSFSDPVVSSLDLDSLLSCDLVSSVDDSIPAEVSDFRFSDFVCSISFSIARSAAKEFSLSRSDFAS